MAFLYMFSFALERFTSQILTLKGGEDTTIVLDSLPFGGDLQETLLPCSPSALMNTDAAQKTLQESSSHEEALTAKAPSILCVCVVVMRGHFGSQTWESKI